MHPNMQDFHLNHNIFTSFKENMSDVRLCTTHQHDARAFWVIYRISVIFWSVDGTVEVPPLMCICWSFNHFMVVNGASDVSKCL